MKKCPYCAEEINDEAQKCRYCNEWIKEDKPLNNVFNSVVNVISHKIKEFSKDKVDHLYIPSDETPMVIRNFKVFSNKLEVNNLVISFSEIDFIKFLSLVSTSNFMTSRQVTFIIAGKFFGNEKSIDYPIADVYYESVLGNKLSKKEYEQVSLVSAFISELTFEHRLNRYIKLLNKQEFFIYNHHYFYKNGDIKKEGNILIANLKEEKAKNYIRLGSAWRGAKSSYDNPYEFVILSGLPRVRFLGLESGNKLKLGTEINHDVFVYLISYFLERDNFPKLTNNLTEN